MNEIQIFSSQEFGWIRVIEWNCEPWFVGKDVADTLEYKKIKSLASADFSTFTRLLNLVLAGRLELPTHGLGNRTETAIFQRFLRMVQQWV